ncbi:VUT family protein [Nocardia farcinica]|uniref:VUT family protein n=1 Tax=Nocardia farcinica TaxID=37329 RepID=UPI00245559E3|nr:VUT family protein [Nocardia farcinica]
MTGQRTAGVIAAAGLLASVIAANYVTTRYGFVPVGFGLQATAGTIFAGVALALRDAIQDLAGKWAVVVVIVAAAVVSYFIASPAIAVASAVAFAVAELLDFAVYTPLRARSQFGDRRWSAAVLASGVVGAVVDTVVFIGLAFGVTAISGVLVGQLVGKMWANLAYLIIGWGVGSRVERAFVRG